MHQHPRPKWLSFTLQKCPRCGKAPVFETNSLDLRNFSKTHRHCKHCHLSFEPESGFYFGAMYFSYAILVGLMVTLAIAGTYAGLGEKLYWMLPLVIIVLMPFVYRYSRMLMLYVVYPVMYKKKFTDTE